MHYDLLMGAIGFRLLASHTGFQSAGNCLVFYEIQCVHTIEQNSLHRCYCDSIHLPFIPLVEVKGPAFVSLLKNIHHTLANLMFEIRFEYAPNTVLILYSD